MAIGDPWGFGVNRAEIQQLVRELVILGTNLPPEAVYLTDTAARGPESSRSWASIQLGAPITTQRTGNDERIWAALEQWTITIDSVVLASNPQRLTILGADYDFTAVTTDPTDTRDGLLTAIGVPVGFTAAALGTDQLVLNSTVLGQRLDVLSGAGNDFTLVKDVANAFTRELRHYELQCNIRCNGLMSLTAPDTTQSGQSLADLVESTMSSRLLTARMRDCGHVPVRVSRVMNGGPLGRQQFNEGMVQVVIATTGRMDVSVSSVTAAPMQPIAVQQ